MVDTGFNSAMYLSAAEPTPSLSSSSSFYPHSLSLISQMEMKRSGETAAADSWSTTQSAAFAIWSMRGEQGGTFYMSRQQKDTQPIGR